MGQIAKALGTPVEFSHDGKTYRLSPWNYGIIGEFETYLQDAAVRACHRMRKFVSSEEFGHLLAKTAKDIATGVYTFGSEEVKKALDSYVHFSYLVYLCLREAHPDVTYEQARELVRDAGDLINQKLEEANSDPNRKTPAPA